MFIKYIKFVSTFFFCYFIACVPDLPNPDEEGRFRCGSDSACKSGYFCISGFCSSEMGDGGQDGRQDGDEVSDGADDGGLEDGDGGEGDGDGGSNDEGDECQTTHQGVEWCDGLDNDCDGDTDENCIECQVDAECNDPPTNTPCLGNRNAVCTTRDGLGCDWPLP